jgi:hypothetical protein
MTNLLRGDGRFPLESLSSSDNKFVISRAGDVFDLLVCFANLAGCFSTLHKAVILSEAPR